MDRLFIFFFQAEDGIRDYKVTGVQTCALPILLLPRGAPRHRVPLWLSRQRSKRLLDAIARYPDFPVLLETWRTCLQDELDLDRLRELLGEDERGEIAAHEAVTHRASPFAGNLAWKQTNRLMYEDDAGDLAGPTRLGGDLVAEVALSAALRPRLPGALVEELRRKLQRVWPGYAPAPDELADWVRERIVLPLAEWRELLAAVVRDHGLIESEVEAALAPSLHRLVALHLPGKEGDPLLTAVELLPRLLAALELEPRDLRLARPLDPASALGEEEAAELVRAARRA